MNPKIINFQPVIFWIGQYPDLPFLAFLENDKENHQKSKDFLSLANP